MRKPEYLLLLTRVTGATGPRCSNHIGNGRRGVTRRTWCVGVAGRMTGSRADRQKGGQAGHPRKLPPVRREGAGTRTVVRGKVEGGVSDGRRRGNPVSPMGKSNVIKGFSVSYQDAPIPPTSKYYQIHRASGASGASGASSQATGRC